MVIKVKIPGIALAALAAAVPAHAQTTGGGLEDFRLPPSSKTTPDVQGPVTPDNPIIDLPAPNTQTAPHTTQPAPKEPTAAPKPTAAAPSAPKSESPAREPRPTSAPSPRTEPDAQPQTRNTAPVRQTAPIEPPSPAPSPLASAEPAFNSTPQDVAPAQTKVVTPPIVAPQAATAPAPVNNDPWWRYVLLGLLLFPMGFAAGQFWRHNKGMRKSSFAPTIERPKPRAVPARAAPENDQPAAPEPLPGAFDEELERAEAAQLPPLRHALETTSLSVTLVNALLSYQLTLTNASRQMIRDIRIAGDIVSAHSSQSMEEQLSGPDGNAVLHTVSGLLPGQSIFLNGQLRMPIAAIRPVKREHAMLFIPLIRMRIEAEGLASALVQTCVVGQHPAGPGAGLRPFRLDAGPRVYTEIGQRTLQPAAQAAA